MLNQFFQLGPIPANQMIGWYDPRLVILSYLVATFASYIALDITGRLRDINNTPLSTWLWVIGGAIAMGAGIWSMHFIGMLAFNLPMQMIYDPAWTALSMVVAIAASAFALLILKATVIPFLNIVLGGIILGCAIAAMHYTGMAAMRINMDIHYLPGLFFLSIVIAIIASEAALWLALKSTQVVPNIRFRLKFVSAFIMGAAICGMHYTGMAAAIFTPIASMPPMSNVINPEFLAITIAGVTFFILGIAFIASTYKESLNQQMLLTARQAGMAEVAASVLHNVGNVLNSINVSTALLAEKITKSKLSGLKDLNHLIKENENNFEFFVHEDARGKHLPQFINSLSDYWETEQQQITNELQLLTKNVEHIRNIIATQQDLSKVTESEQIISIENVIEEAMLISGITSYKYGISIQKRYERLRPVLIDKVKLLQILVNLIHNAKDALNEVNVGEKTITIHLNQKGGYFCIQISDNGPGIAPENITRIFSYGFTTKPQGHGFGLHTSAILAKDMGGILRAKSSGSGNGATFILELPYKTPPA